ncbi:MAG: hypothetical protein V3T47_10030 [Gammaproteobacteria bacterium]
MRKATLTSRLKSIATLLILVTLMTGCAQMNDWLTGMRTAMSKDNVILGAPGADQYIEEMYKIVNGDPATQAEIYADAESAAKLTPGPSTQLRFALVLATPGHSGSNPQQAQGVFRELLSQTELLTPSEIALATIHLKAVEQLIVLGAETRRLRSAKSRAATTEEKAIARRIATVESENRRLRRSLEEAEQKLDAITTIERSLREQANTGETQN